MIDLPDNRLVLMKLFDSSVNDQFMGIDPYDLASSRLKLPKAILSKASFLNKVSPVNIRPLLGIKRSENSKSNALLLHAMANDDVVKHSSAINHLTGWFKDNRSIEFEQFSVGFSFEMSLSRYTSGPGRTSLIISLFTIYAFIELYKKTKEESILEHIHSFEKLLEQHWLKIETADTLWYSYLVDEPDEVYNATAKVGRFFAALYNLNNDPKYLSRIRKILNYLKLVQNADGTWAYSTKISYVDGFHTAFILESIHEMLAVVQTEESEAMFRNGLENYRNHMFSGERPLHFHPNHEPRDVRNGILRTEIRDAANAIILFSKIGEPAKAKKVLDWTVQNFYDREKHYFYFYDNRFLMSRIKYIRWQSWMALAITEYIKSSDAQL